MDHHCAAPSLAEMQIQHQEDLLRWRLMNLKQLGCMLFQLIETRHGSSCTCLCQAIDVLRASATEKHIMISGRFNKYWKSAYMKEVRDSLRAKGAPVFMVDVGPGEGFGTPTVDGLARASVMIAFCTDDYGAKTGARYETYEELKFAWQENLPIIPVQMCEDFPPKPPDEAGRNQNRFVLKRDLIRIVDKQANEPERVAHEIYDAWSTNYRSASHSARPTSPASTWAQPRIPQHGSVEQSSENAQQTAVEIQDQTRFTGLSFELL